MASLMDVGKTIKSDIQGSKMTIATVVAGVILGLMLVQLSSYGWITVVAVLGVTVLVLVGLDGYRTWLILLVSANVSGIMVDYGGFTIRPDQVVFLALVGGWVLALLIGNVRIHKVPMLVPLLLYLGANVVSSALYSYDKRASLNATVLMGIYIVMYLMTVMILNEHRDKLKSAVKFLIAVAVVQSVYAIVVLMGYYLGIKLGGLTPPPPDSNAFRIQGGFQESDILGGFGAGMGLLFFSFLTGKDILFRKWVMAAGFTVVVLALALSYTRAAWLGLVMGLLILVFLQKPKRNIFNPRAAAIVLMLTVVALFSISPLANSLTGGTTGTLTDRASKMLEFSKGSGGGRAEVQKLAYERWQKSWMLGNGTLSLPQNILSMSVAQSWIYSSFLQALHDTGLVGIVLLVWIQAGMIVVMIRGYMKTTDPFYRASLAGFVAASVAMIIASQASSFLWLGYPWIFSGLAVAVALAATGDGKETSTTG